MLLRSAASKVMWVGRATVFLVGLAVILAVVLGLATAALAGTGVGAALNLGKTNTVNRLSQLVGSTDNAMLRVDNNNTGTGATALNLQVEAGHAPMKINSTTKVDGLNADQLDGRNASEFVTSNNTYTVGSGQEQLGTLLGDGTRVISQHCNSGDRLLSGGPASVDPGSKVLNSYPSDAITWTARTNPAAGDTWTVVVLCADTYQAP
jgi:hypothetical protein